MNLRSSPVAQNALEEVVGEILDVTDGRFRAHNRGVVPVNHNAGGWYLLREEVPQPHSFRIRLRVIMVDPGIIGVAIETVNSDDTGEWFMSA